MTRMSCFLVGVPILILACPTWVIRVTMGAVDAVISTVNPWNHSAGPCHVLVVVVLAVPVGASADWAGVVWLEPGERKLLVILEWLEVAPFHCSLFWWTSLVLCGVRGMASARRCTCLF